MTSLSKKEKLIIGYLIGYAVGWPLVAVFAPPLIWPYRISLTCFLLGIYIVNRMGLLDRKKPGRKV
jgi:hypothetical protein